MGNARPIDSRPQSEVEVRPDKLELEASFCYLGDMLSAFCWWRLVEDVIYAYISQAIRATVFKLGKLVIAK